MTDRDQARHVLLPPRGGADRNEGGALASGFPLASHVGPDQGITAAQLQELFARALEPQPLLSAFADGVAGLPGELHDMGHRLQVAYAEGDWARYGFALRQLIDKYIRTIKDEPTAGDAEQLRDLLHHTLMVSVEVLVHSDPVLAKLTRDAATQIRQWRPSEPVEPLATSVRNLCQQIGVRSHEVSDAQTMIRDVFDLLLQNVGELVEDNGWLHEQIDSVRQLLAGPLDRGALDKTRAQLREVIYKQGLLKRGIAESKASMQEMMVTFVDRLEGMASSTNDFHDRISFHAQAVRNSRSIADLGKCMEDILVDTAQLQEQVRDTRDKLLAARREAAEAEQRVVDLEMEIQSISSLVRVDQLTEALNRRGFEEVFEREALRATRGGQGMCLALLDLDDFRLINANHGHLGGDAALRHLVRFARTTLRGSDIVARLGGEEFVILLPDTVLSEAQLTIERLLHQLAANPARHEGRPVPITFSAGVARWRQGESRDDLVARADCAMYRAKQAGKNRVASAV